MTLWTNSLERLAYSAAFFVLGLTLAFATGKTDGAQNGFLPPPPLPNYKSVGQASPARNTPTPATRPVSPRETQSSPLPSFPIRAQRNRRPASTAADAAASPATEPIQQAGVAGPILANPSALSGNPNIDGQVGNVLIAENDSTSRQDLRPQHPATLRVPREIQLRARKMLKAGKRLAERGAVYSARQEFLGVLQLVAQSHDAQMGKRFHTRALANGLQALREADDFVAHRTDFDVDLHLEGLVAGHQTTVLKNTAVSDMTPFVAMQRYYEYASDQLAIAANQEPAASEALYAIGRAEAAMAANSQAKSSGPKPLALYQAAIVVDKSNGAASNELGVLLARAGKLEQAASVLQHALTIRPTPELVNNFNAVNRRLQGGDALSPLELVPNHVTPEMLAKRIQVQWMTPEEYSRQTVPTPPVVNIADPPRHVNPYGSPPPPNQQHVPMMTR